MKPPLKALDQTVILVHHTTIYLYRRGNYRPPTVHQRRKFLEIRPPSVILGALFLLINKHFSVKKTETVHKKYIFWQGGPDLFLSAPLHPYPPLINKKLIFLRKWRIFRQNGENFVGVLATN